MECKHWSTLLLLLVQLVSVDLPLSHWQRFRFIAWCVLRNWLDVEEDGFLCDTIVILSVDDELSSVLSLASVDDEGVVITDVSLHILDTLSKLHIVVVPCHAAVGQGDNSAGEPGTLTLQGEGGLRLDDKPWSSTLSVNQDFLHPVLLHLEFSE